jgi:hypothetical protein
VPGVDTMEALAAAAEAFDATPLGLQVDPDADAAIRESLRRTGLVCYLWLAERAPPSPATGRPPAPRAVASRGDRSAACATWHPGSPPDELAP